MRPCAQLVLLLAVLSLAVLMLGGCAEELNRGQDGASAQELGPVDQGPADRGPAAEQGTAGDGALPVDLALADQGPAVDQSTDGAAPQPDVAQPPAGEMLLVDQDNLQFTVADNGFLPLIKPGDPLPAPNWSSPLDYYDGEFQIRYVIKSPASQEAGKLQTCIWTMGNEDGDGKNYFPESCSSQVAFSGLGEVFNTKLTPSGWWKLNGVPLVFAHPERFLIRVVLRGASGCNVTTYNVSNGCWSEWPKYQKMTFRTTIVMVPKGGSFSGWANYP